MAATHLALDIGEKRIGLAVGDEFVFGRGVIDATDEARAFAYISQLIEREKIETVVVGIPLVKSGEVTSSRARAESWVARLKSLAGIHVVTVDESYSSVEAERQLRLAKVDTARNKAAIDERSAVLILEQFLHG